MHSNGDLSARVYQAQGMAAAQLDCPLDQALAALRIRADLAGRTLDQTANDVIDGVIRFDPPSTE